MKKFLLILLPVLLFFSCKEDVTTPYVDIKPNSLDYSLDSLLHHIYILSGTFPVEINGETVRIRSRYVGDDGNNLAADYLEQQLKYYGYQVENQWFSSSGRNVITMKPGITYPDQYFLFGAHYDSMPSAGDAPGADDNASGTAAVLEAARLFADLTPEYSVIFAFWDEEELGRYGSKYFAELANDSLNLVLTFNADMIAYDHDYDSVLGLYHSNTGITTHYINQISEFNTDYGFFLDLQVIEANAYSDDHSFNSRGFNTIAFSEAHFNYGYDDFNPNWHSTMDSVDKFNLGFYEQVCGLIVTSLAIFSGVDIN